MALGYYFYRKKALINAMSKSVDLVKLGLFRRLKRIYWTESESPFRQRSHISAF